MFEVHVRKQKQNPIIVIRQATIRELYEYEKRKSTYTEVSAQEKEKQS